MIPIVTMVMAALFRTERLQARRLLAGLLAILGVALALSDKAFAPGHAGWTGEALFFAAVLCGGTYNALSAAQLARHGTMPVTLVAMAAGVAIMAVGAVNEGLLTTWPDYRPLNWWLLLFLALPAGAFAFFSVQLGSEAPVAGGARRFSFRWRR